MALSKTETRDLYRKRAKRYDLTVLVYRLFGFRLRRYRQDTVSALALKPGDTVVELGCGTGLNFEYVQRAIGPTGRLIAVDLTDAMLELARARAAKEGWSNVEFVQADMAEWRPPTGIHAAYSTLALTLVPEYDRIVQRASEALAPGGKFAVLDMKDPEGWPRWLVKLSARLNAPFGVSLDLADRHLWSSIERYFSSTELREYYFGALYLCVGTKAPESGVTAT